MKRTIPVLIFTGLMALSAVAFKNTGKEVLPSCSSAHSGKKLVWSDEFSYAGLPDDSKWSYDTAGNERGWGNKESQFYTKARLKNAEVKDGYLFINAYREDYKGFKYTSARLITKEKGDWLYGRMEIKAKLPDGRGMWPAIWMLPTDWEYGGWPASGEIDIMENVGYDPYVILASAHTQSYNHVKGTQKSGKITIPDCYSEFMYIPLSGRQMNTGFM